MKELNRLRMVRSVVREMLILSITAASVVILPGPGPGGPIPGAGLVAQIFTRSGKTESSKDLIHMESLGNTAPTAPRWLKMLARSEQAFTPTKIELQISSKRCFWASVSTEYASCFVSEEVRGWYPSNGRIWP